MADAALAPGLDLPEPDLWLGDASIGIRLVLSRIVDEEMRGGEVATLYRPDAPDHVSFADAVFTAIEQVTMPHVLKLSGQRANARIGPAAEAWLRADEGRRLRHESAPIYFTVDDATVPRVIARR
jgi:hypothetical protein